MFWFAAEVAVAQPLGLTLDRPLARGDVVTATVTGSTFNDTVFLAGSPRVGNGPVPCGQPLDLLAPQVAGQAIADFPGTVVIPFTVPANAPTRLLHFQAYDCGAVAEQSDVRDEQVYARVALTTDADATIDHADQGARFGSSLAVVGDTAATGSTTSRSGSRT